MHKLDGAYQRVRRAGIHLANLNRRVNALKVKIRNNITIYGEPKSIISKDGKMAGYYLGSTQAHIEPIPLIISILVGEIIYNLRSALDYLVYELAQLDSKQIKEGTQFPIEDCSKLFGRRRNTFLKGVSDKHVADIERLQPYNGCDWTRILRGLSNPDKHRHLTLGSTSFSMTFANPFQSGTKAKVPSHPVDVDPRLSTGIQFRSGKTIITIEMLKQLKFQVTQTLDAFKPEFK